jgi:hypothetical protein
MRGDLAGDRPRVEEHLQLTPQVTRRTPQVTRRTPQVTRRTPQVTRCTECDGEGSNT